MIEYCYDSKIDLFWNKKKQVLVETETQDEFGSTIIHSDYVTKYEHGFSIMYELLDENKKLVKYQVETVVTSTTDTMVDLTYKMNDMSDAIKKQEIQDNIVQAKQKYANYTLGE